MYVASLRLSWTLFLLKLLAKIKKNDAMTIHLTMMDDDNDDEIMFKVDGLGYVPAASVRSCDKENSVVRLLTPSTSLPPSLLKSDSTI